MELANFQYQYLTRIIWLYYQPHDQVMCILGDTGFFRLQGIEVLIVKATVSSVFAETANRAEAGQLQSWSEPSEILNLRSSNTPETAGFTTGLIHNTRYQTL